jgi:hypothetical protein
MASPVTSAKRKSRIPREKLTSRLRVDGEKRFSKGIGKSPM